MAKIRIYELATKMGLDNKDVVEKLQQAGIEVKNHMSAIEEDVAQKFEADQAAKTIDAPQAEENVEVKVKEERISSGLIRRRRKTVVKEEPQAEVADVAAEASAEAAAVAEEAAEPGAAPAAEEAAEVPAAEVTEEAQAEAEVEAAAAEPEKTDATPKKKAKKEPTRAKILGRVELPTPVERPRRQAAAAEKGKRPAAGERKRPDRPAAGAAARPATRSAGPGIPAVQPLSLIHI